MKKNYADMNPLEEIRAIREEISGEFKSISDLGEYLRKNHPLKSSPKTAYNGCHVAAKVGKRPASRRRKAVAHA